MGDPILDWRGVPLAEEAGCCTCPSRAIPPPSAWETRIASSSCPTWRRWIARDGAAMEHHPLFPKATNVEYASLTGTDRLRMRVWERGTGTTLACGSGACATAVAAHRRGLTGRRVTLDLDGGTLEIHWRDDGVWMAGPTARVFDGVLSAAFLAQFA